MLHKLALAASVETPTLIKEALPTREQHMAGLERDRAKAVALAEARGVPISNPTDVSTDRIRMNPDKPSSLLVEKEIQKAHGDVSKSNFKKMKHTYVGGAKRAWGGKGFLGGKWRNRAGIAAGVGALGLGMKAYFDSNKAPQPTAQPQPQPQQQRQYQQYPQYQPQYQQPQYSKMGSDKYSPDAVTIPKPTAQPTVPALGPGVGSVPKITSKSFGGPSKGGLLGSSSPGSNAGSTSRGGMGSSSGGSKQAEDAGVLPLLGVAAGGAGGWALGKKYIAPALGGKAERLAAEIAKKQEVLHRVQKATQAAPLGAAAAGAILLAALAALYARKKDSSIKTQPREISPYDQSGAGFAPQDHNPYGQFYG